jgi:outer membrane protein OmpA-like peptidoglycan-associated protein
MNKLTIAALALAMLTSCSSGNKKTGMGAGIGAAVGAGLGAVIGHQSGNRDKGLLVGAAVGGLLGGGVGNYLDKQAKELAQVAETKRTEQGIITKLKGDILFDSGKSNLKPAAVAKIDEIAQILVKYPEDRIKVVGHTDSQGSDELNASLSMRRANAVYDRLAKNGIPSQYIQSEGMGKMRPIASNSNPGGRALNRRVELEISIDEEAYKKRN